MQGEAQTAASAQSSTQPRLPFATILLVLAPFGFGYFLSYFFRAVNTVVAPSLQADLDLGAYDLGMVTAAYFFTFAAIQLPLGVALDRYGPRRVQTVLISLAAAGALLFGYGETLTELTLARALIGFGFAGGLMAGFKAVAVWLPPQRHALANAWVMSAGAVGLLVSTAPTEWAVDAFGWRSVFIALSAVTAVSAALIWLVVPERPSTVAPGTTVAAQLQSLGKIMSDRVFWSITPMLAMTAGTQIAIQTLWAGPWMRDVAGLDRAAGADILFIAAAGFLVGILFAGTLADVLLRRGISLLTTLTGFIAVFLMSQLAVLSELVTLNPLVWFIFGMTGQTAVLAYPWLAQHFGQALAGRSNAAVNLSVFSAAFAVQFAIGAIIERFPADSNGAYPARAYFVAFGVFFAIQVATVLWYALNLKRVRAAEDRFQV